MNTPSNDIIKKLVLSSNFEDFRLGCQFLKDVKNLEDICQILGPPVGDIEFLQYPSNNSNFPRDGSWDYEDYRINENIIVYVYYNELGFRYNKFLNLEEI